MTKPQKWDRHLILAHLRREGITLSGIAKLYELSDSGVKNIWTRPNEKVERALAGFIGVAVEHLFADRYPKKRSRILSTKYHSDPAVCKPQRNAA